MKDAEPRRWGTVRLFSSAVIDQALLSAASLVVGLLLIRHTSDHDYGYYILVTNAFLLAISLQRAFINPALAVRMARLEGAARGALASGLYREQRTVMRALVAVVAAVVAVLWALGTLDSFLAPLLLVALGAGLLTLDREFLRMALFAYHDPGAVLRGDLPYITLFIVGSGLSTLTPWPTPAAVACIGLAAFLGARLLQRRLRRAAGWNPGPSSGLLAQIAPLTVWSTAGAAVHWTFSQGYSYLVAGVLDVGAVAAIAATRLLMMPVNLLSTGINALMLPMASRWLVERGASHVIRRLSVFALLLGVVAVAYFALMWLLRDWIFAVLLKKEFAERDHLLLLWSAIFLLMLLRDQLMTLLVARERFRALLALTLLSALVSIGTSYWAMLHYGQVGALIGMLTGEILNLAGILMLALQEPESLKTAGNRWPPPA